MITALYRFIPCALSCQCTVGRRSRQKIDCHDFAYFGYSFAITLIVKPSLFQFQENIS